MRHSFDITISKCRSLIFTNDVTMASQIQDFVELLKVSLSYLVITSSLLNDFSSRDCNFFFFDRTSHKVMNSVLL